MATLHRAADGTEVLLVKGAPEVIMDALRPPADCATAQTAPFDREHFMQVADKLAAQGERVLALAWLENPGPAGGQPRPGRPAEEPGAARPDRPARSAAQGGHRGGEGMPRGRHPRHHDHRRPRITAAAIAKMLGIGDGKTAITGAEIEEMNEAALQEARARRRRLRPRQPRAQAAPGEGDPGQQADRRDDRRRRQRRALAEEGRHRRRHGHQGHRGNQGGGRR